MIEGTDLKSAAASYLKGAETNAKWMRCATVAIVAATIVYVLVAVGQRRWPVTATPAAPQAGSIAPGAVNVAPTINPPRLGPD